MTKPLEVITCSACAQSLEDSLEFVKHRACVATFVLDSVTEFEEQVMGVHFVETQTHELAVNMVDPAALFLENFVPDNVARFTKSFGTTFVKEGVAAEMIRRNLG